MLRNREESYRILRETHLLEKSQLSELVKLESVVKRHALKQSIVSSHGVSNLWIKLAEESCYALPYLPKVGTVLDVGSGNGIPGLVWAVLRPELQYWLVERVNKKARTLESIRIELGLKNVMVCPGDVQAIENKIFDIITARAVAPLPELWMWTSRCRKPESRYVLFRGLADLAENRTIPGLKETACIAAGRIQMWVGDMDSVEQ